MPGPNRLDDLGRLNLEGPQLPLVEVDEDLSLGLSGEIPIERIVLDNVTLCEAP